MAAACRFSGTPLSSTRRAPCGRSTVGAVADELSFAEKVRSIGVVGLSNAPRVKRTVDDHGTHTVTVTEHNTKDDRVDVTVAPSTVHKTRS